jgi:serine/threonine-protein kinase RsbW
METIRIEVPAMVENIRVVESFIDNAREKFPMNDDIYGNIMISVTEAVNNAIRHGCNMDASKNVVLSLSLLKNLLTFRIEDSGSGFDYEGIPDPTAPENIEKPSGRGIFLMKQLADEVKFLNAGSVVELNFYTNG